MPTFTSSWSQRVFEETFPTHIAYLKQRFEQLDEQELEQSRVTLEKIKNIVKTRV